MRNYMWHYICFIVFFFSCLIGWFVLWPAISRARTVAHRVVCGVNIEGVACAMAVYLNDNQSRCPTENWCDLLVEQAGVSPKSFICPAAYDSEGECSFTMNRNVVGKTLSDLPSDVVLFFETDLGFRTRGVSARSRRYYKFLNKTPEYKSDHVVSEDRFNQYGGPEDLVLRHSLDGRKGCNVVFISKKVEFVTEDRIAELKWTAE